MAITTIPIKYRIPKVEFDKAPSSNRAYTLYYRIKVKDGETPWEWNIVTNNYQVNTRGENINGIEVSGLLDDKDYQLKLVDNNTGKETIIDFHTAINMSTGQSPLYLKKLFPGQSFTWYVEGLASKFIPTNRGGWLFDLTGKFADTYDGFGPMEAPNGKNWELRTTSTNDNEAYNCFNIDSGRVLRFNTEHEKEGARIFADQFVAYATMYGKFYIDDNASGVVILDISGAALNSSLSTFKFGVDTATMLPYVSLNKSTHNFDQPISKNIWYTFIYKCNGSIEIRDGEDNGVSSINFENPFANNISGYGSVPIFVGDSDGATVGLNVCKFYFAPNSDVSIEDVSKIVSAYKYMPTLLFRRNNSSGGGNVFLPGAHIKLGDQNISGYVGEGHRKDIEIGVNYTANDIDNDNPLLLRANIYLYQYEDSAYFHTISKDVRIEKGTNTITFTGENDFAYWFRLEFDIVFETGTTTCPIDLKVNSITSNGEPITMAEVFNDSANRLIVSDSENGGILSLTSISGEGDAKGILSVSIPVLSSGGTTKQEIFFNPMKWIQKITDSDITAIISPDIELGDWSLTTKAENTEETGAAVVRVVSVEEYVDNKGFDINFGDDFDRACTDFKERFCANHTQWGGYNGGCNGNLIYGSRGAKSLIMEQHGDNYDGEVVGVAKAARDSSYTGYGIDAFYTAESDPQKGQQRKTRVGSIAVSQQYLGYGQIDTWMKVPEGTYGVCPALWFFHYQELYPSDPRWQYWIDRGGRPYGGADPYMVINNEIDMELPSHNVNGVFADWDELSKAYFDPIALDDQYKVGVEDFASADRYGTFLLINKDKPNAISSWKQVSQSIQTRNEPSFEACKFNNWIGEKSGGNGWAYEQASYQEEEYLALLTDLGHNYADGKFHKWTLKWYKDKTELWVDDVYIRTNRAFVPFNVMRWTFGGWFPSSKEEKYNMEEPGSWAGKKADFEILHLEINRIKYTPFSKDVAGGTAELHPETYPEAGLRELL